MEVDRKTLEDPRLKPTPNLDTHERVSETGLFPQDSPRYFPRSRSNSIETRASSLVKSSYKPISSEPLGILNQQAGQYRAAMRHVWLQLFFDFLLGVASEFQEQAMLLFVYHAQDGRAKRFPRLLSAALLKVTNF